MTTRLRLLPLVAGLLLGLFSTSALSASASVDAATATLKGGVNEVLDTIYKVQSPEALAAALRPILDKHFQLETTTRLAVGPGWRQFTPEQRKRTTELFADLVLKTYTRRMTGDARPEIVYLTGTDLGRGKVELPTTITYQGQVYSVVYRLSEDTGAWRIYDVIIEGVSMVANYRGQFGALYNKGGADEIIRTLETKAAEPAPAS
ncbi:MAG: ABC transporter substrate-binding protein [Verrucomicrobiota bacterium]